MEKEALVKYLGDIIESAKSRHPLRVGIDGVDASGKTTLANALADYLQTQDRPIIRASIDGFHKPKSIRYQKGRNSPEGYYKDSFNNRAIIDNLLAPLGSDCNSQYTTAVFDFKTDSEVVMEPQSANPNSILIMEGVFLFRPELFKYWDLKIFITSDFETTVARAAKRDGWYLGKEQDVIEKYNQRYVPGQKLYLKEANPELSADFVIDNNDFENPIIVKNNLTKPL
jgi:uridine kinase